MPTADVTTIMFAIYIARSVYLPAVVVMTTTYRFLPPYCYRTVPATYLPARFPVHLPATHACHHRCRWWNAIAC